MAVELKCLSTAWLNYVYEIKGNRSV